MKNYLQNRNYSAQRASLFDAIDDLFRPVFPEETDCLKADISETDEDYRIAIAAPGFNKEQIKLTLENGYLNVICNKKESQESKDKKSGEIYRRKEISEYATRSFYVGDDVAKEDVRAKYENGVLSLEIPKIAPKLPEKTYITIE